MSISAKEARQRFYPLIRQINEDHEPIEVTSREHGDVVMMSAEDFRSWQETVHLLRSARNAQILMESVAEPDSGPGSPAARGTRTRTGQPPIRGSSRGSID